MTFIQNNVIMSTSALIAVLTSLFYTYSQLSVPSIYACFRLIAYKTIFIFHSSYPLLDMIYQNFTFPKFARSTSNFFESYITCLHSIHHTTPINFLPLKLYPLSFIFTRFPKLVLIHRRCSHAPTYVSVLAVNFFLCK